MRDIQKQMMLQSVRNYLYNFVSNAEDSERAAAILDAIEKVDRNCFIDDEACAYLDMAMPVGEGQTISQPSTVARMLMLLELKSGQTVLEVGAGSGWNAALISYLIYPGSVVALDVFSTLIEKAIHNLSKLKDNFSNEFDQLTFLTKNIFDYVSEVDHQFDRIIFAAGIDQEMENKIFDLAKKLLNESGILVCPYQHGPLMILQKQDGEITTEFTHEQYVFVPLIERGGVEKGN